MWIVTRIGFFSAVQKTGEQGLTVRSRVRRDLVNLLPYLPKGSQHYTIVTTPANDYEYRIRCTHDDWSSALSRLGEEVDYDNFKSEIGRIDRAREHILHSVWSALFSLTGLERPARPPQQRRRGLYRQLFGGTPEHKFWDEPGPADSSFYVNTSPSWERFLPAPKIHDEPTEVPSWSQEVPFWGESEEPKVPSWDWKQDRDVLPASKRRKHRR